MSDSQSATIAQFAKILAANIQANIPTMVFGQPGLGKTETAQAIAAKFASRFTGGCFVISTTEYNPIDLAGLYKVDEYGCTTRCPSTLIPLDKPVLILIDEFGDCPAYEQSGWYRLLHNQTLGESKLAEGSYVCAATNRPEDNAASREVSTAAKGRCCCVTLRADATSVREYAIKRDWSPIVTSFIAAYPNVIDEGFNPDDFCGGSTPRDFERLNRLEKANLISSNYDIALLQIIGNIGSDAGHKYAAFRKLQLPAVSHVFDNPKHAPILDSREMQFAYCAAVIGAATAANFESVTEYALRLDRVSGFAMFWDLKTKFASYKSSAPATRAIAVYSELF